MTSKSIMQIKNIILYLFLSLFSLSSFAQSDKSQFDVELANRSVVRIQVCSDQIFRIRVSADTRFPEALMKRCGILKTGAMNPEK